MIKLDRLLILLGLQICVGKSECYFILKVYETASKCFCYLDDQQFAQNQLNVVKQSDIIIAMS